MSCFTFDRPADHHRLRCGAVHLWRLGPRPIGEFINEVCELTGAAPLILNLLDQYRSQLSVETVKAVGAQWFPPRALHVVPAKTIGVVEAPA